VLFQSPTRPEHRHAVDKEKDHETRDEGVTRDNVETRLKKQENSKTQWFVRKND